MKQQEEEADGRDTRRILEDERQHYIMCRAAKLNSRAGAFWK